MELLFQFSYNLQHRARLLFLPCRISQIVVKIIVKPKQVVVVSIQINERIHKELQIFASFHAIQLFFQDRIIMSRDIFIPGPYRGGYNQFKL